MEFENKIRLIPDDKLLDIARRAATELERRELLVPEQLGRIASQEIDHPRKRKSKDYLDKIEPITSDEDTHRPKDTPHDPFLQPGSSEARRYATQRGSNGMPRWMEPFSPVDMFGEPTVFSSQFGRGSRFKQD